MAALDWARDVDVLSANQVARTEAIASSPSRTSLQRRALLATVIITSTLALSACAALGPDLLRAGRNDYNIALQRTGDEQVLLNVVRLKYRDNPVFLEVSSVATQFDVGVDGSASASLPQSGRDVFGLSGRVDYSEKPTVTYNLLQGESFVQRFLAPVEIDTLLLLSRSGWSIERVLRVLVEKMNDVSNAPRGSGPQPAEAPEFEDFARAASLLRQIQIDGLLEQGFTAIDDKRIPVVQLREGPGRRTEIGELFGILGLDLDRTSFTIEARSGRGSGESIGIATRSLMGILFFLSQGVEVPDRDVLAGRVTVTRDSSGAPFDWSRVVGDLFRVRTASSRPDGAFVAIPYRGSWFYVDDSDLSSKSTFVMLSQLISLQAGQLKGAGPILTLPLGG